MKELRKQLEEQNGRQKQKERKESKFVVEESKEDMMELIEEEIRIKGKMKN